MSSEQPTETTTTSEPVQEPVPSKVVPPIEEPKEKTPAEKAVSISDNAGVKKPTKRGQNIVPQYAKQLQADLTAMNTNLMEMRAEKTARRKEKEASGKKVKFLEEIPLSGGEDEEFTEVTQHQPEEELGALESDESMPTEAELEPEANPFARRLSRAI